MEGSQLGDYQIVRLIGRGGMGAVYAAENIGTGKRVAIKTLHTQWTSDSSVVQRFLREARAATRISHPNVVDVLDAGRTSERGSYQVTSEAEFQLHLDTLLTTTRPAARRRTATGLRSATMVPVAFTGREYASYSVSRASILAAQIKSFSDRPPMACVL